MLDNLVTKWRDYLEVCDHHVYRTKSSLRVIRSRNGKRGRYLWLLLTGHGPERILSKTEQSDIRWHLEQARKLKENTYLVVGFTQEHGRIIILPAKAAMKTQCIRSDKGGIEWDDWLEISLKDWDE